MTATTDPLDAAYLPTLKNVDFRPIFILGDHRSGTTLFYKMLAATGSFNFVDFYHVIRYDELLYNHYHGRESQARAQVEEEIEEAGLHDRGFDRIEVSPDLPEEYGYLLKENPPFWYLPRVTPRTLPNMVELCRKVQTVSPPGRPLLLKNPWDFPNFLYLKRVFPNARFLFIHRHPLAVHNSKLKAMRSALSRKNRYTAWLARGYDRLFRRPLQLLFARFLFFSRIGVNLLLRYAMVATDYFLENTPRLPDDHYISIRYEDLCQRPDTVMATVLDSLNLQPARQVEYASMVSPRPLNLLPDVARKREQIQRRLEPYLTRLGYPPAP